MSLPVKAPTSGYSIGEVARMSGVSVAALRAWERRYEFLNPGRNDQGHRLYAEHDLWLVLQAKKMIEHGISPGSIDLDWFVGIQNTDCSELNQQVLQSLDLGDMSTTLSLLSRLNEAADDCLMHELFCLGQQTTRMRRADGRGDLLLSHLLNYASGSDASALPLVVVICPKEFAFCFRLMGVAAVKRGIVNLLTIPATRPYSASIPLPCEGDEAVKIYMARSLDSTEDQRDLSGGAYVEYFDNPKDIVTRIFKPDMRKEVVQERRGSDEN
ncbi:MerR family transcriptional regulator [Gilvimarinus sp. SDUM040013]|uniref:MerR family transcriptional regulator n=1 Tax=Gilvimarinus gilvus TaxID=3058038 RepID=A0ABU4S6T8_9GAMM|nr:MerR family transcriptional regulator [Gilvimarinus sp. SDUM040013]MDO3385565.1 MerR family transcriptional regulator [Gilvimarinus sp. SDUM040013]MDX6851184.1 MerR family transcriptional regulator [Gilvimarinus sp. SDUM040013]